FRASDSPRRRARAFWLLGLLALLAAGAAGAGFALHSRAGAGPSAGGGGPPADDRRDQVVVCRGYADAEPGVRLVVPSRPGRVARVLVKEGPEEVAAGTVLIEMEDEVARSEVEAAEANLAKARDARTYAEELKDAHPLRIAQQEAALQG